MKSIVITALLLTGCATSSLDRHVAACFGTEGRPSYTESDGYKKFNCAERIEHGNASAGR